MAQIKLFVDAHCFDSEYQGSRTFVKEIYQALAHKKDIVLFLAAYDIEKLKENFTYSDTVVFLKYSSRSSLVRLAYDIPRLIKKHRIDYAHFQYITPLYKNCKQVVTIHDVIFNDYPGEFSYAYRLLKKFLYKRSASTADILTTVSHFSKASIKKHLHAAEEKIHVIPNGVNLEFFDHYNKQQAKNFVKNKYGLGKFILYVSRIEPRKNHLSLLKAFLQLKLYNKGYHLALIGHSTRKISGLKKLLVNTEPSIKSFVFFSNNVNDEELLQLYRAADVFTYPSKAEGFGIPPLEAGAARVPVICSNTSAMSEYAFFGDYHIDPLNYETLKKTLAAITEKEQQQEELDTISETIKSDYSWEHSAEKLYQLITTHKG